MQTVIREGARTTLMHHPSRVLSIVAVAAALCHAPLVSPLLAQEPPTTQELADLRARAEAGDADAQSDIGFMYGTGQCIPQDVTEAVRWLRLAAEQGHARAQVRLPRSRGRVNACGVTS